jgi:hypothetical protein
MKSGRQITACKHTFKKTFEMNKNSLTKTYEGRAGICDVSRNMVFYLIFYAAYSQLTFSEEGGWVCKENVILTFCVA